MLTLFFQGFFLVSYSFNLYNAIRRIHTHVYRVLALIDRKVSEIQRLENHTEGNCVNCKIKSIDLLQNFRKCRRFFFHCVFFACIRTNKEAIHPPANAL